jgi:hypothetical protein
MSTYGPRYDRTSYFSDVAPNRAHDVVAHLCNLGTELFPPKRVKHGAPTSVGVCGGGRLRVLALLATVLALAQLHLNSNRFCGVLPDTFPHDLDNKKNTGPAPTTRTTSNPSPDNVRSSLKPISLGLQPCWIGIH